MPCGGVLFCFCLQALLRAEEAGWGGSVPQTARHRAVAHNSQSANRPVPNRKETFLLADDPLREKFARLTAQEENTVSWTNQAPSVRKTAGQTDWRTEDLP
ncbi:MAG: hypothetical protein ACJ8FY_05555 [Gemmataceae bacterium]